MLKKILKYAVYASIMYASLCFADSSLFNQQTSPQAFHTVGQPQSQVENSQQQQLTSVAKSSSANTTMATTDALQHPSALPTSRSIHSLVNTVNSGPEVYLQPKKFDARQEFQQLSIQEQQFEKLAANKISDLYAQNNMLTQQVTQLQMQLSQLGHALNQVAQQSQSMHSSKSFMASKVQDIENTLGVSGSIIMLIGILVLVTLLATWPLWRAKKMLSADRVLDSSGNQKKQHVEGHNRQNIKSNQGEISQNSMKKDVNNHLMDDSDDKAEYDFMSTQEGINAKLDLARAYIAMEDKTAALQTLKEVLSSGNQEQQRHAQQLMAELG